MSNERTVIEPMTSEDLQKMLDKIEGMANILGFDNYDSYIKWLSDASEGLIKFGGGFGNVLGYLIRRADDKNKFKIVTMWRKELDEHAELYLKFKNNNEEANQ